LLLICRIYDLKKPKIRYFHLINTSGRGINFASLKVHNDELIED
jgi:hypothetical protein